MNKTVFITGSSSGIGKAAAKFFAEQGWNVVATMRRPEAEKDLRESTSMRLIRLDVQDEASIHDAVRQYILAFGKIDVLVNNAGYGLIGGGGIRQRGGYTQTVRYQCFWRNGGDEYRFAACSEKESNSAVYFSHRWRGKSSQNHTFLPVPPPAVHRHDADLGVGCGVSRDISAKNFKI